MTYPPTSSKHFRSIRLLYVASFLTLCLIISGCYGAAIDTRDIDADEVTITTHTPWSQTTVTAKGWKSRVKAQEKPQPAGP